MTLAVVWWVMHWSTIVVAAFGAIHATRMTTRSVLTYRAILIAPAPDELLREAVLRYARREMGRYMVLGSLCMGVDVAAFALVVLGWP